MAGPAAAGGPASPQGRGRRAYSRLGTAVEACADCRRAVAAADVLYFIASLTVALVLCTRLQHGHPSPGFTITRSYLGPQSLAVSYATASLVVVGAAAVPVLLLAVRPALWVRHRGKLALANRLLRLGVQCGTFLTPGAVQKLAVAIVGRAVRLQDSAPTKAAVVLLLQPLMFYVQPATAVLPWQLTCVLQSCTAALIIYGWVRPLPCFVQLQLQAQAASAGTAAGAALQPYEHVTQAACYTAQGVAAALRTAVGEPVLSTFSASVCAAPSDSLRVLQVWAAIVCLVIAPTLATLCFEQQLDRRSRTRQLAATAAATAEAAAVEAASAAAAAAGSSSSSRSRQRAAAQVSGERQQQQEQEEAEPLQLAVAAAADGLWGWSPVTLVALLLVLLLPVAWLLAEVVAEALASTTDCSAVLAAASVA